MGGGRGIPDVGAALVTDLGDAESPGACDVLRASGGGFGVVGSERFGFILRFIMRFMKVYENRGPYENRATELYSIFGFLLNDVTQVLQRDTRVAC